MYSSTEVQKVAILWGAFLLVYRWYNSKTSTVGVHDFEEKLRKLH
jgi:hypothetical protein